MKNSAIEQAKLLGYTELLGLIEITWLGKPQPLYSFENTKGEAFYVGYNKNCRSVMFTKTQFDHHFASSWKSLEE